MDEAKRAELLDLAERCERATGRATAFALMQAAGLGVAFVNAGNISRKESARNALAQWANDCERRLLNLSCGAVLERTRHREWADRKVAEGLQYLVSAKSGLGFAALRARAGGEGNA